MKEHKHLIRGLSLGTEKWVHSFHYGLEDEHAPSIYFQAGLHASEIPGMLVLHYLRQSLALLEEQGRLKSSITIVPVCNPIGLDQTLLSYQMGRFDFATGQNFNRLFPNLAKHVAQDVKNQLSHNVKENILLIRKAYLKALANQPIQRAVDSLRQILMSLSGVCDWVFDLHCDCESVLHIYTHRESIEDALCLNSLLDGKATLYSNHEGGSFDEIHTAFWNSLQEALDNYPITNHRKAFTVELRGQLDVSHQQAKKDAQGFINFLIHKGLIEGNAPYIPRPSHEATPLDGTDVVYALGAGVICYHTDCGTYLKKGQHFVDIVDPISGIVTPYYSRTDGILFARQNRRYATAGMDLGYIAGKAKIREGNLLSM